LAGERRPRVVPERPGDVAGVAAEPGVAPGVAVPPGLAVGDGLPCAGVTVVSTGDGNGDGPAPCAGGAVAEGATVAVSAGATVAAGASAVAEAPASGVADAESSCAGASVPRQAANRAAPARPVARMRRVKWMGLGTLARGRADPQHFGTALALLERGSGHSGRHPMPTLTSSFARG
jgi:hypothetical protein